MVIVSGIAQEVGRIIVLGNGTDITVCGNVSVGYWWSVKFSLRMGVFEELFWVCPGPSLLFRSTLLVLAATPLQVWLCGAICAQCTTLNI